MLFETAKEDALRMHSEKGNMGKQSPTITFKAFTLEMDLPIRTSVRFFHFAPVCYPSLTALEVKLIPQTLCQLFISVF